MKTAEELVQALLASDCGFKMCGSRALGTHTEQSDFDLYAPHTRLVHDRMVEHAFARKRHADYQGSHIYALYERHIDGKAVQVAIEYDVAFRDRIMEALRDNEDLRELDASLHGFGIKRKLRRDRLWATLYQLAGFNADDWNERKGERRTKDPL